MATQSFEVINSDVTSVYLGTTTITNPTLILEVDGVVVPGSILVQSVGQSTRTMFPRVDATGKIYITAVAIVYQADLPAFTKSVKVYVAEAV